MRRLRCALLVGLVAALCCLAWTLTLPHESPGEAPDSATSRPLEGAVVVSAPIDREPVRDGVQDLAGARGVGRFLMCVVVDLHSNMPIAGLDVSFMRSDGVAGPTGTSDNEGVVVCDGVVEGQYHAEIATYGYVASLDSCVVQPMPHGALSASGPARVTVVPLYAACVRIHGAQPYDGVFTWSRQLSVIQVDIAGLGRNRREAERLHGKGVQLYPLAEADPLTGVVALFFEREGVFSVPVFQQRLTELRPVDFDTVGLPLAPGAAGFVSLSICDVSGRCFEGDTVSLARTEPFHGLRFTRATAGAVAPVPPGDYTVGLIGLPVPWMFMTPSQVQVQEGKVSECTIKGTCRMREVELKVATSGSRAGVQFSWGGESGQKTRWGPLVAADVNNVLRCVLPVGPVRWRLFSGGRDESEGRIIEVSDGQEKFVATLNP